MKEQHPGLPRQRKRIAFITDAPSATSFTPRLLSGIALFIQKRRSVVLQQVPFTEIANDTLNGRFDGIISNLCATHTRNLLAMLNGASLPIVDTGAEIKDPSLIRVDIDIVREGTMAAEWFLRRGFRNFAYCGFHGVDTYPYSDILEGAFAAKRKKGLQRIMWIKLRYARPRTRRHGESPVGDWRRRFHGRLRGVTSTFVKSPSPPFGFRHAAGREKRPSPHTKLHEKYDTDCWQTSVDWKQLFETTSFYGGQQPAGLRTRAGIRLSRSDQVG